jgi:hypothetical protein
MSPPSISSTDEYVEDEDEAATDLSRAATQAGQPGCYREGQVTCGPVIEKAKIELI